jgi:hypothetical protein
MNGGLMLFERQAVREFLKAVARTRARRAKPKDEARTTPTIKTICCM